MASRNTASLFSFEVAVKTVFLKRAVVCRVPSISVRFLDYPHLELNLITDDELKKVKEYVANNPESTVRTPQILELQYSTGTYSFTQGKSCLIKTKLSELEEKLCEMPVYVMLLDVLPNISKLVASFALSLESTIRNIVRDVSETGIEVPSAQGERDVFPLYNLMGDKVGEMEMGVRLTSLGIMMLEHVSGISEPVPMNIENAPNVEHRNNVSSPKSKNDKASSPIPMSEVSINERSLVSGSLKSNRNNGNKENIKSNKVNFKEHSNISETTQTIKQKMLSKYVQIPTKPAQEALSSTENIFCPPALYYDRNSDAMERNFYQKQQRALSHKMQYKAETSLTMSDLESDEKEEIIIPSSVIYKSPSLHNKRFSSSHATQTEKTMPAGMSATLGNFPILKALVEEVVRLGLNEPRASDEPILENAKKELSSRPAQTKKPFKPFLAGSKTITRQPDKKQPLRFGLTNSMRLRMAMNKATIREREQYAEIPQEKSFRSSTKAAKKSKLGQTYTVKHKSALHSKRARMVNTACGPDSSMYRRMPPKDVRQQTVYLGRMAGYEEATDLDVPSMGHLTSESRYEASREKDDEKVNDGIEDLMIVKELGTPRAHSRQSQRSIEIHLPTASTEFTLGKDDEDADWESTFSDKEKLIKKNKIEREKIEKVGFYSPPESSNEKLLSEPKNEESTAESDDKFGATEASASEQYKYSDDFEDDKTWSATRTPSAVTPINSTMIIKEEDEEEEESTKGKDEPIPPFQSKSFDSTITTTRTSDFTDSYGEEIIKQIGDLRSASGQKLTSSDEGVDSSSISKGSIVTALMKKKPETSEMKVGKIIVPGPIPSDSPVIQSINTESGSTEQFPMPEKHSLTAKSSHHLKKKTQKKEVHLPKTIKEAPTSSKRSSNHPPPPKPSRMTPSPPSTRRFSPISSPESSKERMRRMYHHPGRRNRPTSSGSGSSDFEKPVSPIRRSDSVSSYQPSEISDISNVRLSEDLENLSDILSEETNSQSSAKYIRKTSKNKNLPSDGPKTYFGKPKLDPNTKLGYTT